MSADAPRPAVESRLVVVLVGLLALAALLLAATAASSAAPEDGASAGRTVLVTEIATPITPVIADHLAEGIDRADAEGFAAYVVELDTPGGLVEAMRDVVEDILASEVPVVVHISPAGARAGSAGAIITFASHVAVMAPGTTIGAATPVGLQGEEVSDKIVNDAAAQAEALARLRGRDADFAADAVRGGRTATVDEALELGVVEARASSLDEALRAADGRVVTVAGEREVTVRTAGAAVERDDLGAFRRVLQFLADPNITFLLLTLGTLGLIYELATPGVGVAGATGITALLLALFSLSVLPVTAVGLLLLVVAVALFAAELFAPGVAGFAFGGAVVLVLAAVFLFDNAQGVSVDPGAAVPLAVVLFAGAVLAGRIAYRSRHMPSTTTGADLFRGRAVRVSEAAGTTGRGFVEGAWWSLRSVGPPLRAGETAVVAGMDGLVLLVEPASAADGPAPDATSGATQPVPGVELPAQPAPGAVDASPGPAERSTRGAGPPRPDPAPPPEKKEGVP
ncbi:nodulation protein NfeD [Georgenia sp. AZ-5]|uniref:NfeD family protein n=1 Tax=Georgenia sp. AZ-5 TaxID=3367526 RepID=UPI0037553657